MGGAGIPIRTPKKPIYGVYPQIGLLVCEALERNL